MPDSANILSILQMLAPPPGADQPDVQLPGVAQPPQNNVLQAAAPQPAAAPPPPPAVEDIYHAATAASPPQPTAKPRRSLLDTIGRISDVLAKVGGADPLYQPTLDAREKHGFDVQDHGLAVDSAMLKNATDKFDLGDKQNLRVGQAARGLKAIRAANPSADVGQAWSAIASQMQLDPATTQSFGRIFAEHPEEIDGVIASMTDPKYSQSKYGGTVVYGKDANGKLIAFQPSLGDDPGRTILPDGVTPVDPQQFIDTGGAHVGVGKLSGNKGIILPNTPKPDTVLTTTTSRQNNRDTNQTAITIAGMPARASQAPGKGTSGTADMGTAMSLLDNIERGFNDLHKLQALPGDGSGAGQLAAAFGRTALGQHIGEQVGNAPAQKRVEIEKDINSLQSEMVKSLPGSATRTRFEQEIQRRRMPDPSRMSYQTGMQVIADLRRQFAQAQKDAAAELANKGRVTPKAAASGWSVVKVQ